MTINLREDEIKDIISALTFAYNNGNSPEEFGSFSLLEKFKELLDNKGVNK